ncbi:TNT domain-containing protein [Mycobacterium sp. E2497]|uniref:TNT domain-containing protein n=1 Tax=Mycobacterium sp. E2497 TaxID=1834135 RepID=UPI0007FF1B3B|nr:glycohydrolase toxin TNT-related protein [Mycobacterium sp. E2497]OBI15523.1 NAD(+)--arginine ADP-ribosyltransferase [Mycobacterium sp. E2497]
MAPLACDPTALDRTGATVLAAGESLGSVISGLTAALGGSTGMAGDDPVGAALGRAYDGAAAKVIDAMVSTRNGLCSIGDGVRVSAHNYALAEALSDVNGQAAGLPAPQVTAPMTVGAKPPSAVGTGSAAPAGWGWVAPYIGMIWPSGDSAKLRAAAAAWATAGANFMAGETAAGGGTMAAIGAQQIPEGAAINKALADASEATINVARQCQTIAAQLNGYAAKVDKVHAAILDLLSRICDPLTGIKEVWDLLTDEDEDEIKRIADDIRTVVDNFAGEAETLGAQINAAMTAAVAAAEAMGRWTGKEWDHFLHGTSVGRVLNHVGQSLKGVGVEAWDWLEGMAKFSPSRLQSDPVGYGKDVIGMVAGEAPLVGLGPDGGPGVAESWKALGKQVTHWDEWGTNPAEAFGKTLFDVGTLALPGGPLSKLGKLGRGLGDVVRDAPKPPLPDAAKPPSVKPPAEPPPAAPKPPESGPPATPGKPEPGKPAPPASGKPAPGPADGPLPHSPTESKPPVGEKPPAGEPPKPAAAPTEPVGKPAMPAPAEQAPLPHPKPAEPVPAHAPSPPGEPAAAPSAGLPSLPEPHLPTPPSVPMGGAPAEAPPGLGEIPHEPGVHPPEMPGPQDGGPPHLPDEGPPHGPGDNTPQHHPGESNGPHHGDNHGPHPPGDENAPQDSHPDDGGDTPSHHPHGGGDHDPPKARDVFPDAKEFGELSEDQYRQLFVDEDGNLRYPDVNDPAKPYAVAGTVRNFTPADIASLDRQWLDRIGHPAGNWLAFEGTPYEGRSLPHTSLDKPYQAYQVDASVGLPPGWKIEFSIAAPWFGHPGGDPQLLILAPEGEEASVQQLIDTGFLKD